MYSLNVRFIIVYSKLFVVANSSIHIIELVIVVS